MAKIFICGDVVNTEKQSGEILSPSLEQIVLGADYAICNFEAPVEGAGSPIAKSGPHIQQKATTLYGLKKQGFDLIQLANNHIMDFGSSGLMETIKQAHLAKLDVIGAGADFNSAYKPLIKEINGVVFGIINACEAQFGVLDYFQDKNTAGYAWINHNQIDKNIIDLKKQCDFVLVLSHAGLENYSIPQREWRERYQHFCDLGADVVVGAHPHVPQGFEEYKASLIFYSLGNFYFDWGGHAANDDKSYAVMLEFDKASRIKVTPVFHITRIEQRVVDVANYNERVDIKALSESLKNGYEKLHEMMVLSAYEKVKTNFLRGFSVIPRGHGLKSTIKELVASLLGRRKHIDKKILSLHLIRNEAYYYVTRNALELEARGKAKK
ncbi:poly-gamma-glutamate synthesis protein (capsule biosynthesis protein) [Halopseudomonas formosensis]|uniref:Poly-gamma-glutamate synthesis protein (Capsule biosynthesis protein) n=1 Tax=Halopseudomonas formosensis TaxID=1002526 RepID=A0A1I6AKF6_9GAMM|nr:CapA family protein [Halopseudomonas formosensis]SFQ68987.1 poly-gamma-glutamate synthesis protein (capsule biosynthesis protein) [Halopseudomonas formosensis]